MVTFEEESRFSFNYFSELKDLLQSKGWKVKGLHFQHLKKTDKKEKPVPLRVDGWL